jgi:hypothetical protein
MGLDERDPLGGLTTGGCLAENCKLGLLSLRRTKKLRLVGMRPAPPGRTVGEGLRDAWVYCR